MIVQVKRSCLWHLKGCSKHKFFEKKAIFSVKKCICPMFSQFVEFDKPQKTIHKSQKDILTINVEALRFF